MRGWITDPTGEAGLRLAEDLPEPSPSPDEIVLDVRAYSLNRGELSLIPLRPNGWRPGQDVSGVVVRAAASGGPKAGTRVVGIVDWNGWAERVAIPRHQVAPLPDSVSFVDAATLPVAGLTALRAVRLGGDLLGRKVLVTGATGGVGQLVVQLAAIAGAHVTAQVSSEARFADARALGAHEAVTSLQADGLGPFAFVADGVGGPTLVDALHKLAPGGTVAMYGVLGGKAPIDIFDFAECPNAKLVALFLNEPGATSGEELGVLAGLVAEGRLRPSVGLTLDWTRTPEALAALRGRALRGKAVLTRA